MMGEESLNLLEETLQKYWGYSSFRPNQKQIVQSIYSNQDTLAILPTGGGKSICFQAPAMAKEGICIVVSPLIALMQDQVDQLRKRRIKSEMVVSGMSLRKVDYAYNNCIFGDYKFLYIAPERLSNEIFLARFKEMNVSMIAVDEAHCISQWGYDFRPSYLSIAELREIKPEVPVIALTATATPVVQQDIVEKLALHNEQRFTASLERKNLGFNVRYTPDKINKLLEILSKVGGQAIVYASSRRKTKLIADELSAKGISATFYNAGLSKEERAKRQHLWMTAKKRVMVATNAFGMGIDKADVRLVIHFEPPENLESYYQEAGRAGRDGKNSLAVLLTNDEDKLRLEHSIQTKYPSETELKNILLGLFAYLKIHFGEGSGKPHPFSIHKFAHRFDLKASFVHNAILSLVKIGWLELSEAFYTPSKIQFLVKNEDLYRFQVNHSSFENLVKYILRNYPGVFEQPTKLSEEEIAKKINEPLEEVKRKLQFLHKGRFANYYPKSEFPLLTFLEDRPQGDRFVIRSEELDFLRERHQERVEAMLAYIKNSSNCRTELIQTYFGEKDLTPCGVCDICLKSKKKVNFPHLQKDVLLLLDEKPHSFEEILESLSCSKIELEKMLVYLKREELVRLNETNWERR